MRETLTFTYDGMEIHYITAGHGTPVLFLHGWGCDADIFAPIYQHLAKTHTVYSLDFPGHGKSDIPKEGWGVVDFAAMCAAFIKQQQIEGCDVIAHSFGGRVVIYLASLDPHLFSKIVLTDAAGIRPKRTFSYYTKVYSYKLLKLIYKIKPLRALLKEMGFDIQKRIEGAGSEDYKALAESMRHTFSKVVNEDLKNRLPFIKNPTLLIWGSEDQDTPMEMAKTMEKMIPDAGLVTFEGAGHYAFLERAADFNVIVSHFLSQNEGAST